MNYPKLTERELLMLMAEIRLGGIHDELLGNAHHAFNIGNLTEFQQKRLIQEYEELHGVGTLRISASVFPNNPIPDINSEPKTDELPNSDFIQYQYKLEKEVITLANEIRADQS